MHSHEEHVNRPAGAGGWDSIIPCSLIDPMAQYRDLPLREGFVALVRHAQRGVRASLHQHIQYAPSAIAGNDHGTIHGTLHQAPLAFHVESGFEITLALGRPVALEAIRFQERIDVLVVADRLLGRAGGKQGDDRDNRKDATPTHG
jgi:hypothetical protein